MSQTLTEFELQILQECANLRPASPWGAAVGAALEFLTKEKYVTKRWEVTEKGREALRDMLRNKGVRVGECP